MIDKHVLDLVNKQLKKLETDLVIAKGTRDMRRRHKHVDIAKLAISNIELPNELYCYLSDVVGANPLSYQHADSDIGRCITALEELMSHQSDAEK